MPLLSRCRVLCTVYPTQIIIFMEYPKLVLWGRGLDVPGATGHFFGIPCKYYFQLGARQREKKRLEVHTWKGSNSVTRM